MNKWSQLSIRTHHDNTLRVRAAQFFNILLPELRIQLYQARPRQISRAVPWHSICYPSTGYTLMNNNSLLSWRRREDELDAVVLSRHCQTHQNLQKHTYLVPEASVVGVEVCACTRQTWWSVNLPKSHEGLLKGRPRSSKSEAQGELNIRGSEPCTTSFLEVRIAPALLKHWLEVDFQNSRLLFDKCSMA